MPLTPQSVMYAFAPQLKKCSVLQGLSDDELNALLQVVRFENFQPGEEILTEGLNYQSLWVLLEGDCVVVKRGSQHPNELAQLTAGSAFGEMSFLDSATHSASVVAKTSCQTLRLMRVDYERLQVHAPTTALKLTENIVRVLSDRLRRMDQWTCELVERPNQASHHEEWQEFRAKLHSGLDS